MKKNIEYIYEAMVDLNTLLGLKGGSTWYPKVHCHERAFLHFKSNSFSGVFMWLFFLFPHNTTQDLAMPKTTSATVKCSASSNRRTRTTVCTHMPTTLLHVSLPAHRHPHTAYYEWKLKNLAFLSEKPEVPKKGSQEEQRRAELRRQYLETHNNNTAETHPPVPESAEEGEEEVQAGFNFVGKDMMPAPAAGAEPMSFTMAKPAPSAVQMPYPPAGTSHPPLPPLPPPSSFAPPPMTEPIRPTRVIRRPTSPRVLPEVVPAALTEGEVADMDVSDVVRYESYVVV